MRLLIAELELEGCGGFQSGRAGRAVSVLSSVKRYEFAAAEHLSIKTYSIKNIFNKNIFDKNSQINIVALKNCTPYAIQLITINETNFFK